MCLWTKKVINWGFSSGELLTKPDRSMLSTSVIEVVGIKLTWKWQGVSLLCGPGCIFLSENLPLLKGLLVPDSRKLVLLPYPRPCLFLALGVDLPKAAVAYSRPFDGREIDLEEGEAGKCSCLLVGRILEPALHDWHPPWSICLDPPVCGER